VIAVTWRNAKYHAMSKSSSEYFLLHSPSCGDSNTWRNLVGLLQSRYRQRNRSLGHVGHLHHLVAEEVTEAPRRRRLKEVLEILVVIVQGIVQHCGVHLQRAIVLHLQTERLQVYVLARPETA
jgi:hypothetical protein